MPIPIQQKQKREEKFVCLCGNDFFALKTYVVPIKRDYKHGQKFDILKMKKRLKCARCGRKYWEVQLNLSREELEKVIKKPDYPPYSYNRPRTLRQ